jgi:hypothetical protein
MFQSHFNVEFVAGFVLDTVFFDQMFDDGHIDLSVPEQR